MQFLGQRTTVKISRSLAPKISFIGQFKLSKVRARRGQTDRQTRPNALQQPHSQVTITITKAFFLLFLTVLLVYILCVLYGIWTLVVWIKEINNKNNSFEVGPVIADDVRWHTNSPVCCCGSWRLNDVKVILGCDASSSNLSS